MTTLTIDHQTATPSPARARPHGRSSAISNGKVDGDTLTWSSAITQPFPMTLEFTGTVDGDTMTGNVKVGAFGSFPFKGSRA